MIWNTSENALMSWLCLFNQRTSHGCNDQSETSSSQAGQTVLTPDTLTDAARERETEGIRVHWGSLHNTLPLLSDTRINRGCMHHLYIIYPETASESEAYINGKWWLMAEIIHKLRPFQRSDDLYEHESYERVAVPRVWVGPEAGWHAGGPRRRPGASPGFGGEARGRPGDQWPAIQQLLHAAILLLLLLQLITAAKSGKNVSLLSFSHYWQASDDIE